MSARLRKQHSAGGELEVFNTPAWCVRRLLDAAPLPEGRWLEPCAGEGAIIKAVGSMLHDVQWTACELREVERVKGVNNWWSGDFLRVGEALIESGHRYDVCVMNPPFSKAVEFVKLARRLAPLVAVLLPLSFFESDKRRDWLAANMPKHALVLPNRPCFVNGKSNSIPFCWAIWDRWHRAQTCEMSLLPSTPKEER